MVTKWHGSELARQYLADAHGIQRSAPTLARRAATGEGPAHRHDGRLRQYAQHDLDAFADQHLNQGSTAMSKKTSVDAGEGMKTAKAEFDKGGKTPMFGEQQAAPKRGGTSAQLDSAGPGKKFAEGGNRPTPSAQQANPQRPGRTGSPAMSEGPLRPRSVRNDYTKRPR